MESPMHRFYKFVNEFSLAFFPTLLAENLCVILKKRKNWHFNKYNEGEHEMGEILILNVIGNLICVWIIGKKWNFIYSINAAVIILPQTFIMINKLDMTNAQNLNFNRAYGVLFNNQKERMNQKRQIFSRHNKFKHKF